MSELGTLCNEAIERKAESLRQRDSFGMLSQSGSWGKLDHYLYELATIQAIAEKAGLNLDETLMFEFGAHQYHIGIMMNENPWSPSISHFFALQNKKNYYAIDLGYSDEIFEQNIQITKELIPEMIEGMGLKVVQSCPLGPYLTIDFESFGDNIKTQSLSYSDAEKKIKETSKKIMPLIFSNNVFNDPEIKLDSKFWKLPGIHVHLAGKEEMEERYRIKFDKETSSRYLNEFRKTFEVENKITLFEIPYRGGSIIYHWSE